MKTLILKSGLVMLLFWCITTNTYAIETIVLQNKALDYIVHHIDDFKNNMGPVDRFLNLKNNNIIYEIAQVNNLNLEHQNEVKQKFDTLKPKPIIIIPKNKTNFVVQSYNEMKQNHKDGVLDDLYLKIGDPFYDKNHNWYITVSITSYKYTAKEEQTIYLKFNKENKIINYFSTYWIA